MRIIIVGFIILNIVSIFLNSLTPSLCDAAFQLCLEVNVQYPKKKIFFCFQFSIFCFFEIFQQIFVFQMSAGSSRHLTKRLTQSIPDDAHQDWEHHMVLRLPKDVAEEVHFTCST